MQQAACTNSKHEQEKEESGAIQCRAIRLTIWLVAEGIFLWHVGGALFVFAKDFFRRSAFDEDVADGAASIALGVVGVVHPSNREFFSCLGVSSLSLRIEHVFCNEAPVFTVVAVFYGVEELFSFSKDLTSAGVAVCVHAIDGDEGEASIAVVGLFCVGAIVWAAAEFGSGAVVVAHEADVGAGLFPLFLILVWELFASVLGGACEAPEEKKIKGCELCRCGPHVGKGMTGLSWIQ